MTYFKYGDIFQTYGQRYGQDPRKLFVQVQFESAFDPNAVSRSGAMGLAQFMPRTWKWIWEDVIWKEEKLASLIPLPNPFFPRPSIQAQARYMSILMLQFGDWRQALAAYNYGQGNISKILTRYPDNWEAHLPNETRKYIKNITKEFTAHA